MANPTGKVIISISRATSSSQIRGAQRQANSPVGSERGSAIYNGRFASSSLGIVRRNCHKRKVPKALTITPDFAVWDAPGV